jgi:hypothetical protein
MLPATNAPENLRNSRLFIFAGDLRIIERSKRIGDSDDRGNRKEGGDIE